MDEKNISSLKARLIELGFEPSVEIMLRCNICFMPTGFDLLLTKHIGKDSYQFSVHLEKGDKDLYELRHYLATLRKYVVVPSELEPVSNAMQLIDWNALVKGKQAPGQINNISVHAAFDVLEKLQSVGTTAEILKYKYWMDTPLEPMIPQLAVFKNDWEIAERFYFFDETLVITFNDAVRFLSSRWIEKQVVARKKLLVKKTVGDRSNGSGAGRSIAGGKLLSKNPRRLGRHLIDKAN